VSASRVHTKAHHANDVIGGAALGLLFGMIAKRIMPL
jgi:membrane-associated phospholipid phosphatase